MSWVSGSRSSAASALGVPPAVLVLIAEVEPEGSGESIFAFGVETGVNRFEPELNAWGMIAGNDGARERAGDGSAVRMVRLVVAILGGWFEGPGWGLVVLEFADSVDNVVHTKVHVSGIWRTEFKPGRLTICLIRINPAPNLRNTYSWHHTLPPDPLYRL